jgi:hypothetical protein
VAQKQVNEITEVPLFRPLYGSKIGDNRRLSVASHERLPHRAPLMIGIFWREGGAIGSLSKRLYVHEDKVI